MRLYFTAVSVFLNAMSYVLPQEYYRYVAIILKTLPRDLRMLLIVIKITFLYVWHILILDSNTITMFDSVVKKYANKPCFLFEDQVWTFKEANKYSNKISQIFQMAGLKKGDVASLVMTNRPEYTFIWLGLAKIGVITAFINTNLRDQPLLHCINASASKIIIYSSDLADAINEIRPSLRNDIRYYQLGSTPNTQSTVILEDLLETVPSLEPIRLFKINQTDHLVYVYTSGTTGLPKAAIIPHSRFVLMGLSIWSVMGLKTDDILYDSLPLYHTAGGLLDVSAAFCLGATVVLRRKFSASAFINDCIRYKCTVAQYIGEMCRYILAVPEKTSDRQHQLRLIIGVGLQPAIWTAFVERFNIPDVREVYGSTEGNFLFVNLDNTVGAVGFMPRVLANRGQLGIIIKFDNETMEPVRGPDGLCIKCAVDEPGMIVGLINNKIETKKFYGYVDKRETKKKYIYDVLRKGDQAFLTGDILVMDELGYLYFKDRIGDTFRWKGENVSTSEVEAVISAIIGLKDCIVYGVQVSDLEGRAGMAAIADPSRELDVSVLPALFDKSLPRYAQPIVIRIIPKIELTGTFKMKKTDLVKEGFDPTVIKDPLFFRKGSSYVALTKDLYEDIVSGKISI